MTRKPGTNAPIVYKKIIKKKGGGHHGGAWKVAYADFMTAMMAFFLLLWILSEAGEGKSEAVAAYFQPKSPLTQMAGSGVLAGDSVSETDIVANLEAAPPAEDAADAPPAPDQAASETPSSNDPDSLGVATRADNPWATLFSDGAVRPEAQEIAPDGLGGLSGDARAAVNGLQEFALDNADQAKVEVAADGTLKVSLLDVKERPFFRSGSFEITPESSALIDAVVAGLADIDGVLVITGHTDAAPFNRPGYSNWELSADRANAVRRALLDRGVDPARMARISGLADTEPEDAGNPLADINRRVTIEIHPR
ncbi:flagellar motor protein MotB [Paracoccus sp. ME4]|uniref:flagellar motor protein MotB n=1 Tax=Paracoccus sp. ME4 TaxID=3138066 RepID=UPI00398AB89B